ncbi:MAG: exosortase/archaeosortase family protein [Candidatus Bathyarchaeota archaeon]|nr:MAG: exosortase/archaeosortase family protein [Candidatus Bathyarchaeota archaeon]
MNVLKIFSKVIASLKLNSFLFCSAALILISALIVYWQDLLIILNEALQSESVSHILIVPFFIGFLLYQKKENVKAALSLQKLQGGSRFVSLDKIIGLSLCFSAFLLYWYGSYTFYPVEYHLSSLPLLIIGMSLILFNRKTLVILIFPILFLLFLVPPPSVITYSAGALMANFNTRASYTLLQTAGLPVTLSTEFGAPTITLNNINNEPIYFAIDLACSGVYSLTAFVMFATFLAYIIRGSIFRKSVMFTLGFLILIALNIIRISSLDFIGYRFGEEIAMSLFHSTAGWILIFVGILLLLIISEKFLNLSLFLNPKNKILYCIQCKNATKELRDFCLSCGRFLGGQGLSISKRSLTKLMVLLLGCTLITLSIQVPVFAFAQGPAITSQNLPTSANIFPPPPISGYNNATFLDRDKNYEKISGQDASLLYAYLPFKAPNLAVYILIGVADSVSNLHNWEVCLVTWQTTQGRLPLVSVLASKDVQILQNPPIIARYFVFQSPANYTQVTLYWYERILFNTGTIIEQKYVRISLIILVNDQNNHQELEEVLIAFGKSIAIHWEPLKKQSFILVGVQLQQCLLIGSMVFAAFTGIAQYSREKRIRRNNLKIFKSYASSDEKLLLQTIQKLNKDTKETTLKAIKETLKNADKPIGEEMTAKILRNLENHGMIKKDIVLINNIPKLVWKS